MPPSRLAAASWTANDLARSKSSRSASGPSRTEQLSLLLGQILSPGANLVSQLGSVGGALASQIEQRGEGEEAGEAAEVASEVASEEPAAS